MPAVIFIMMLMISFLNAEEIRTEGKGLGVTREEALTQAKRDALAKGIGQVLIGQTEVENYMVKKDLVITKTMGSILSYKILSENNTPDSLIEMRIQASVSRENIREDLAALNILRESAGNPRVALLISETPVNGKSGESIKTETRILSFFKNREFETVDPGAALKFRESPEGVRALAGDEEAAAKIGEALNAEVLIVGTAIAKENDLSGMAVFQGSGMKGAAASVSLKAFSVSNRRVLAAGSAEASAVHASALTAGQNAMEKSADKLLNEVNGFFDKLVKAWQAEANDGGVYQITINGVGNYKQVKNILAAVKPVSESVIQRGYARNRLSLEVKFAGSVADFCEHAEDLAVKGTQGRLRVESCFGSSASLKLEK